jgi:hypothetical protein
MEAADDKITQRSRELARRPIMSTPIADNTPSTASILPTFIANAAELQTNQFNGTEFSTFKKGDFSIPS